MTTKHQGLPWKPLPRSTPKWLLDIRVPSRKGSGLNQDKANGDDKRQPCREMSEEPRCMARAHGASTALQPAAASNLARQAWACSTVPDQASLGSLVRKPPDQWRYWSPAFRRTFGLLWTDSDFAMPSWFGTHDFSARREVWMVTMLSPAWEWGKNRQASPCRR